VFHLKGDNAKVNMMDRLLHDSRFEDFLALMTGGSSDHDHLNGTHERQCPVRRREQRHCRRMLENDMLDGGTRRRTRSGADSGNDRLSGGNGSDLLVGGFGSDGWMAAAATIRCLSRSDAGEMVAAQDGTTQIFGRRDGAFTSVKDYPHRWSRGRHISFRRPCNAKDEIVAKHVNATAPSDWHGVTGKTTPSRSLGRRLRQRRDHRLQSKQGDKHRNLGAHRRGQSIEHLDSNGDGRADYSLIHRHQPARCSPAPTTRICWARSPWYGIW